MDWIGKIREIEIRDGLFVRDSIQCFCDLIERYKCNCRNYNHGGLIEFEN